MAGESHRLHRHAGIRTCQASQLRPDCHPPDPEVQRPPRRRLLLGVVAGGGGV